MFRSLGQFCYKGKPSWRINGLLMPIHTSNLNNLTSEATCSMSENHATFSRRWTWIPGVRALLLLSAADLTTYKRARWCVLHIGTFFNAGDGDLLSLLLSPHGFKPVSPLGRHGIYRVPGIFWLISLLLISLWLRMLQCFQNQ